MKNLRRAMKLLALWGLWSCLFLPAAAGEVLLSDDFSGPVFDGSGSGVWILQEGQARLVEEGLELRNGGADGFAARGLAAGGLDWTDYELAFRARLTSAGSDWRDGLWVAVRHAGPSSYVLGFYAGRLFLYKNLLGQSITGSKPLAMVEDRRAGLRDGDWHAVSIRAEGASISVHLDGDLLLTHEDTDAEAHFAPLRRGGIVLSARRWTGSERDAAVVVADLRVTALEGTEAPAEQPGAPAGMIRPWLAGPAWPSFEDVIATLRHWADTQEGRAETIEAGRSLEGEPILALRLTDRSVSDDDKHVLLLAALDAGGERNGSTAILRAIEWLLGEDPAARAALRRHVVVALPVPNPYGYINQAPFNSKRINPYHGGRGRSDAWDVAGLRLKNPEDAPHLQAFIDLVDRFQPDVVVDFHGIPLLYAGQLVQPSIGSAYSNLSNRPWDWRLTEYLQAFANRSGYGFLRMEADAQQLFYGEAMEPWSKRHWLGRPLFYTAQYAATRYHSLIMTTEVAWEEGGVEIVKGLLDFGNRQFEESPVPGFPVNRARYGIGNINVCAYGATAAARRASRVELWQRQEEIGLGFLFPYTDGRDLIVCTLGSEAHERLRGESLRGHLDALEMLRNLRGQPGIASAPLEAFVLAGPQPWVALDAPSVEKPFTPLEHGLAIEFPVFYRDLSLLDLRLNGRLLEPSALDGYQAWYSSWEGYTLVRVNIPPAQAAVQDTYVITCSYRPAAPRDYGFRPPPAVTRRQAGGER